MLNFRLIFRGVSAIVATCLCASPSLAQEAGATKVKNIVLVHGAFADGTSWSKLIPLLEARGYHVVAVAPSSIGHYTIWAYEPPPRSDRPRGHS